MKKIVTDSKGVGAHPGLPMGPAGAKGPKGSVVAARKEALKRLARSSRVPVGSAGPRGMGKAKLAKMLAARAKRG